MRCPGLPLLLAFGGSTPALADQLFVRALPLDQVLGRADCVVVGVVEAPGRTTRRVPLPVRVGGATVERAYPVGTVPVRVQEVLAGDCRAAAQDLLAVTEANPDGGLQLWLASQATGLSMSPVVDGLAQGVLLDTADTPGWTGIFLLGHDALRFIGEDHPQAAAFEVLAAALEGQRPLAVVQSILPADQREVVLRAVADRGGRIGAWMPWPVEGGALRSLDEALAPTSAPPPAR